MAKTIIRKVKDLTAEQRAFLVFHLPSDSDLPASRLRRLLSKLRREFQMEFGVDILSKVIDRLMQRVKRRKKARVGSREECFQRRARKRRRVYVRNPY